MPVSSKLSIFLHFISALGYRNGFIPVGQSDAENVTMAISGRGRFVSLRPGHFMSNVFMSHISAQGALCEDSEPEEPLGMISPKQCWCCSCGGVTRRCGKDSVYNIVTPNEMAAILSRLLERDIPFRKFSPVEKYHMSIKMGVAHTVAVDIVKPCVNPIIEILLGRKPQTFKEYLSINRNRI